MNTRETPPPPEAREAIDRALGTVTSFLNDRPELIGVGVVLIVVAVDPEQTAVVEWPYAELNDPWTRRKVDVVLARAGVPSVALVVFAPVGSGEMIQHISAVPLATARGGAA